MSGNAGQQLAPWEELVYFNTPKWTLTTVTGSKWTQICPANPQRTCLMISVQQGMGAQVTTDPSINLLAGFPVPGSPNPLVLLQPDHQTLCTSAWYGTGASVVVQTVEVILRTMPGCDE